MPGVQTLKQPLAMSQIGSAALVRAQSASHHLMARALVVVFQLAGFEDALAVANQATCRVLEPPLRPWAKVSCSKDTPSSVFYTHTYLQYVSH